jgi:hypothetical protein
MLWEHFISLPTASAICEIKTEPTTSLSDHADLPCALLISLLMRGYELFNFAGIFIVTAAWDSSVTVVNELR